MKKSLVFPAVFALIVAGFFMTPVYAMGSMDCHQQGSDFGPHIAMMAPEHPKMYGAMFGDMVSHMAQSNPHKN